MSLRVSQFRTSKSSYLFTFFQFHLPGVRKWMRSVVWEIPQWKPLPFDYDKGYVALRKAYAGGGLFVSPGGHTFSSTICLDSSGTKACPGHSLQAWSGEGDTGLEWELRPPSSYGPEGTRWVTRGPSWRQFLAGSSLPQSKRNGGLLFGFVESRAWNSVIRTTFQLGIVGKEVQVYYANSLFKTLQIKNENKGASLEGRPALPSTFDENVFSQAKAVFI